MGTSGGLTPWPEDEAAEAWRAEWRQQWWIALTGVVEQAAVVAPVPAGWWLSPAHRAAGYETYARLRVGTGRLQWMDGRGLPGAESISWEVVAYGEALAAVEAVAVGGMVHLFGIMTSGPAGNEVHWCDAAGQPARQFWLHAALPGGAWHRPRVVIQIAATGADGGMEAAVTEEEGWWPEEPPELCDDREFLYPDEAWSRDP